MVEGDAMNALAAVSIIFAFGCFVFLVIFMDIKTEQRLRGLVDQWAMQSDYRIVECEKRWLRPGPYWFKSKSQNIYRVVVADARGHQRCAWLRCGGAFWLDSVDVEWEE